MDWTPIHNSFWELSSCNPIDHPEYILPYGQTVDNEFIADGGQYDCLNRGDENPFLIRNITSKTWTQWINTPCPKDQYNEFRRCLGSKPDVCVNAACKYLLLIIIEEKYIEIKH